MTIPPAPDAAAGERRGLEYAAGDRAGQNIGGDGAELGELVDRIGERPVMVAKMARLTLVRLRPGWVFIDQCPPTRSCS